MIQPGTSALFLLLKNAMVDEILKELEVFKGKILRTILSEEDDAMLRQAMVSKCLTNQYRPPILQEY